MMMLDYMVLTATSELAQIAADELAEKVNDKIRQGWIPSGGFSLVYEKLDSDTYKAEVFGYFVAAQAMTCEISD